MNLRMQKLFGRLMNEAAADGDAGGGTDRGDALGTGAAEVVEKVEEVTDDVKKEELPRDDAGKFIPKARFDDAVNKERTRAETAERRLAELDAQQNNAVRYADIDKMAVNVAALRAQERAALLDGNEEKAATLSTQADALNRRIAIAEAGSMSAQDQNQAKEDIRMELTIERLEDKYSELNSESDNFDQDLVDDILDKQNGLMQRERLSPSKALAKATEQVMKRYAPAKGVEPEVEKKGLDAASKGVDRKEAAVSKSIAASRQQPGSLKESGMDSDKMGQRSETPAAGDMSSEEFAALPESTRSSMRGDFV